MAIITFVFYLIEQDFLFFSFLIILSFFWILFRIRQKREKQKREKKEFFNSLLKAKVKSFKEGSSVVFSFTVPSPEFFKEMTGQSD